MKRLGRNLLTVSCASLIVAAITAAPPSRTRTAPSSRESATATKPDTSSAGDRMSGAQQANIQKLADDLRALRSGSAVTDDQIAALAGSLGDLAEGATKPDQALVDELARDLADAMADATISPREAARLANDLEAVMSSANVSPEEVEAAIDDAEAILEASGVNRSDVETIVADLQAIANAAGSSTTEKTTKRRRG